MYGDAVASLSIAVTCSMLAEDQSEPPTETLRDALQRAIAAQATHDIRQTRLQESATQSMVAGALTIREAAEAAGVPDLLATHWLMGGTHIAIAAAGQAPR